MAFIFYSSFMFSPYSSIALGWCVHAGFVIVSFVGGILFISWAMKLKPDQLKKWVMWLLVVGILGSLLTSSYSFMGWKTMMRGGQDMMMNGSMMNEIMKDGMMMDADDMKMITPGERVMNR